MKLFNPNLATLAATLALASLPAAATTVRVHYPAGQEGIRIRGDKGLTSWEQGVPAALNAGPLNVWTYSWPDALGDVTMKPTLGADKVSVGGVYKIAAGATLDVYPFFGPPFGKVTIVKDVASPQLDNKRALRIYLPPSYDENPAKRYPVIYMHDGQNLFDPTTASYGVDWGVSRTINHLVATGAMDEVIVVGIDNTPDRIPEYTPCCDPKYGGGKLDAYGRFIVETVKPWVDSTYRTLPSKASTAIMGSSLGGIASVLIAERYPQVFSKAAGMSSSFWWNKGALISSVPAQVPIKFYLDAGTQDDGLDDTIKMRDAMLAKGWRDGVDLMFYKADGGRHNEASWAARVDKPLVWFFPWGSTVQ